MLCGSNVGLSASRWFGDRLKVRGFMLQFHASNIFKIICTHILSNACVCTCRSKTTARPYVYFFFHPRCSPLHSEDTCVRLGLLKSSHTCLLGLNKRNVARGGMDFRMRHDWNSLLGAGMAWGAGHPSFLRLLEETWALFSS